MPWKKSPFRAIGAWMYLTNRRVLLVPGSHEQFLGHKVWWALREDIAEVDTVDPTVKNLLVGGIRNMLKIELQDGSVQLFNPYKPSKIAKEIREWISSEGEPAAPDADR
ncbi:hypothetical protein [Saccharopolyspora antimicrobica]|uniref:hypothetical protein n=1 Tax=Saccharopolyspora antimicrobica TaxID=455193 RepID=UPI001160497D|nr:hypothetical protein [Saccharopolyspora antimicrobica]